MYYSRRFKERVFMHVQPLVIANWKMNGSRELVSAVSSALGNQSAVTEQVQVVICPPATLLPAMAEQASIAGITCGAQTASAHAGGAHTGELSLALLQEFGVRYVLVGHSERRQHYGETDADVAAKTKAIIAAGCIAVVCVGETAEQREQEQTKAVIAEQLAAALADLPENAANQLVVAYEPVWAIGTGLTATPEQAQDVHAFIRANLKKLIKTDADLIPLLYGGSVKPDNAASLFAEQDIDGGLIGGASLVADDFIAICSAAKPA